MGGTFNGTGYQLRKEADEGKKGKDVFGGLYLSAININGIREGLEGIERDAYRKDDIDKQGISREMEELAKFGNKKVVIFESSENQQIEDNVEGCPSFSFLS